MPFVDYISLENNDIIGLWKNSETLEELLFQFQPTGEFLTRLNTISLEKRKIEFLITHILLEELYGERLLVNKNQHGKPTLPIENFQLSISHADLYSAVYLCENKECGIDVEVLDKRMVKLSPKFVSDYEQLYVSEQKETMYYSIIWSVKEAIYKWYAKRGLDFKQNMIIHPFTVQQAGGLVYYEFVKNGQRIVNIANYQLFHNHVIAWVSGLAFQEKS